MKNKYISNELIELISKDKIKGVEKLYFKINKLNRKEILKDLSSDYNYNAVNITDLGIL